MKYEQPKIEMLLLDESDVITTSPATLPDNGFDVYEEDEDVINPGDWM